VRGEEERKKEGPREEVGQGGKEKRERGPAVEGEKGEGFGLG
jgi:hypothetical protein